MDEIRFSGKQYLVVFFFLAIMAFLFGYHHIFCYDSYWHTTLGKIMVNQHTFAKYELLSYTAEGQYWVNAEWLGSVLIYLFYHFFGDPWGFVIFQMFFVFLFELMIFKIVRLYTNKLVYPFLAIVLVLISDFSRITARPHIISDVFFSLYIYFWAKAVRDNNYKSLYYLIPLHLIWFNMHGAANIGLGMIFLMWLGELIDFYFERPDAVSKPFLKHGIIVISGCALIALINPYGIRAYEHTFSTTFGSLREIMHFIAEWQPVLSYGSKSWLSVRYLPILFSLISISFFVNRANFRTSHILAVLAVFYLLWGAARFAPHFSALSTLVVVYNFKNNSNKYGRFIIWFLFIIVFGLFLKFHYYGASKILPIDSPNYIAPKKMVDFLEENNIHGKPVHHWPLGAYLSFRRWPEEKVFMDGRNHIYGREFFMSYLQLFSNDPVSIEYFKKMDADYGFDYFLVTIDLVKGSSYLLNYLLNDQKWKLVYFGYDGLVVLKDVEKFKDIISKYEYKELPPALKNLFGQFQR